MGQHQYREGHIMKYLAHIIRILFLALLIFLLIKGNVFIWLALLGISLIVAVFFGRLYCGYLCPMNTLMIPVEWLSKKLKIQTAKTPKCLEGGYFTWISLGVSVAAMLVRRVRFVTGRQLL
jgi:polyferredoxin